MLPLHQRRIIAFVLGKAITDNFYCPTSPLILLRGKFAYATEDKAQPLYAERHALEFPCSIYMAKIQVGGPRAEPDPPDQRHQLFIEYNFKLLLILQVSQVSTHFHFWSLSGVSLLTIGTPTYKPLRSWCVTTQSGYPTLRRVQSLLFNVI